MHWCIWSLLVECSHSICLCWDGQLLQFDVEKVVCVLQQQHMDLVQFTSYGRTLNQIEAIKLVIKFNFRRNDP